MDFEEITNQIIKKPKNNFDIESAVKKLKLEIDIEPLLELSNDYQITDKDSAKNALSMSLQSRKIKKALDQSRMEIIRPHLDFQRAINKIVKDYTTKLEEIEKNLKKKLDSWLKAQSTFEQDFSNLVIQVEDGNLKAKKEWNFYIEDFDQIPKNYLVVDEKKIKEAIKAGIRNIPGIKILEEETTSMRTKN